MISLTASIPQLPLSPVPGGVPGAAPNPAGAVVFALPVGDAAADIAMAPGTAAVPVAIAVPPAAAARVAAVAMPDVDSVPDAISALPAAIAHPAGDPVVAPGLVDAAPLPGRRQGVAVPGDGLPDVPVDDAGSRPPADPRFALRRAVMPLAGPERSGAGMDTGEEAVAPPPALRPELATPTLPRTPMRRAAAERPDARGRAETTHEDEAPSPDVPDGPHEASQPSPVAIEPRLPEPVPAAEPARVDVPAAPDRAMADAEVAEPEIGAGQGGAASPLPARAQPHDRPPPHATTLAAADARPTIPARPLPAAPSIPVSVAPAVTTTVAPVAAQAAIADGGAEPVAEEIGQVPPPHVARTEPGAPTPRAAAAGTATARPAVAARRTIRDAVPQPGMEVRQAPAEHAPRPAESGASGRLAPLMAAGVEAPSHPSPAPRQPTVAAAQPAPAPIAMPPVQMPWRFAAAASALAAPLRTPPPPIDRAAAPSVPPATGSAPVAPAAGPDPVVPAATLPLTMGPRVEPEVVSAPVPVPSSPAAMPAPAAVRATFDRLPDMPSPSPAPAGIVFASARAAAEEGERRVPGDGAPASSGPITAPASVAPMARTDTGAPPPLDMTQPRWPTAMIERIETLRDAADAADTRIRLVPDALGAIEVAVRREGDTIHVRFTAEEAQTRTLLQEAQPRLAEAAADRGLKLGLATVDPGTPRDAAGNPSAGQQNGGQPGGSAQGSAAGQPGAGFQSAPQQQPQQGRQHQPATPARPVPAGPHSHTDAADDDGRVA